MQEISGFVRHAALAKDICDRIVPPGLSRAPLRDSAALLAQMNTAQVIGEIRRGQAQDSVDEAHAPKYRTSAPDRSQLAAYADTVVIAARTRLPARQVSAANVFFLGSTHRCRYSLIVN
jgi:hypothetical protein